MKLHILPLYLCLFCAVFAPIGDSAIASNELHSDVLTFEHKTLTQSSSQEEAVLKSTQASQDISEKEAVEIIAQPHNAEVINKSAEEPLSVNSYKNTAEIQTAGVDSGSFGLGMYYGFAGMILLLNLICFLIFSEKVFLYYTIATAALIGFFTVTDGIVGLQTDSDPIYITSLLFVMVTGCSALFSNKYLNLKEFFPKISLIGGILLCIAGVMAVGGLVANDLTLSLISRVVSFTVLLSFFTAGVLLFSKKNYAKFFIIGISMPLVFVMDYFILAPNGIYLLGVEPIHLKIASVVEMLLLSYAIVYRMQAIKEEIVLRQTEMRIFLKRQEAMTRQSVERLMEDMYLENLIMHYDLDGMEIKLLQYISEGKANSKIARKLKVTEEDVEEMTKELYHKLEISEHIQEDYRMVDSQPDYIYN